MVFTVDDEPEKCEFDYMLLNTVSPRKIGPQKILCLSINSIMSKDFIFELLNAKTSNYH